jgi:hypothetical protein
METATVRQLGGDNLKLENGEPPVLALVTNPIEIKMLKDQVELEALRKWEEGLMFRINAQLAKAVAAVDAKKRMETRG